MLSRKRRLAKQFIQRLGLSLSVLAKGELIDMIVSGAKQFQRMQDDLPVSSSDQELTLMSLLAMVENRSAHERLSVDARLGEAETDTLMEHVRMHVRSQALELGLDALANRLAGTEVPKSDREWAIDDFRSRMGEIENSDQTRQMSFAVVLASFWRDFLNEFGTPTEFAGRGNGEQVKYLQRLLGLCQTLRDRQDVETLLAAEMLSHYLSAIINEDGEFEQEIAQRLEQHVQNGWSFAKNIRH